jgi:hypothetical protein
VIPEDEQAIVDFYEGLPGDNETIERRGRMIIRGRRIRPYSFLFDNCTTIISESLQDIDSSLGEILSITSPAPAGLTNQLSVLDLFRRDITRLPDVLPRVRQHPFNDSRAAGESPFIPGIYP